MSKYPELYPMDDEDVEAIYESFGISPEDLEDMKNDNPTRFDKLTPTNENHNNKQHPNNRNSN